jgi:hypothetical protein
MNNPFDFFTITNDSFVLVLRITRGSARWDFPLDILQDMSTVGNFGNGSTADRAQNMALFLFSKITKLPEFEDLLLEESNELVGHFFNSFTNWLRTKR